MSNEAPTDALRLVPVKATPQQLEAAAFNLSAEIGAAEAMKLGPHIERAYELLVAAAPASPLPGGGDEALIAELKEAREHLARCVELVPEPGAIEAADAFLARNGESQ